MKNFKFPTPVPCGYVQQSTVMLTSLIDYIKIILKRIDEEQKIYEQFLGTNEFIPYLDTKLAMDIKTLYLYAKIYLDFFMKHLAHAFFPEIDIDLIKCDNFISFTNRLKGLEQTNNESFEEFKKHILKYKNKLFFRIIFVRNITISHRDLDLNEFYRYDDKNHTFYIHFHGTFDSFQVKKDLKNNIIKLGKKFGIEKSYNEKKISDLVFLDSILEEIESREFEIKNKDENILIKYRKEIGYIISKNKVFELLYDFSEEITTILKQFYPDMSQYYVRRFQY